MGKFFLFNYLRNIADKSKLVAHSSYKTYYDRYSYLFSDYASLNEFDNISTPFDLVCSCIVLEGINNKLKIEGESELYQEANLKDETIISSLHARLPYMKYMSNKIYIPFFTPIYNKPYDRNLSSLLSQPYISLRRDFQTALINPFDTYGYELFNSFFTNLIPFKVSPNKDSCAFYAIEFEMILVINDQGLLEEQINLFDTDQINRRKEHLFSRLNDLMDAYYAMDKKKFIDLLESNSFFSKKACKEIRMKERLE